MLTMVEVANFLGFLRFVCGFLMVSLWWIDGGLWLVDGGLCGGERCHGFRP